MVEPNVKEGKGELRDLHTLFWIAKLAYRADSIIDIVDKGVLRETEARRFAAAQRFLWTVRHLHILAGRPGSGWILTRRCRSPRAWGSPHAAACATLNAL